MDASSRLTTRQKWESLLWLLLGVGLLAVAIAIWQYVPPESKDHYITRGQMRLGLAGIGLLLFGPGFPFGAAIGTLLKNQFKCAVIGVFAWLALVILAAHLRMFD